VVTRLRGTGSTAAVVPDGRGVASCNVDGCAGSDQAPESGDVCGARLVITQSALTLTARLRAEMLADVQRATARRHHPQLKALIANAIAD
jgi:hypothetical protein